MNRGRRGEVIFFSDADRNEFLKVLRETTALWNLRVSAYCLMLNHYHLLVQTTDGNLARAMRHLNGVYTQRFNRRFSGMGNSSAVATGLYLWCENRTHLSFGLFLPGEMG